VATQRSLPNATAIQPGRQSPANAFRVDRHVTVISAFVSAVFVLAGNRPYERNKALVASGFRNAFSIRQHAQLVFLAQGKQRDQSRIVLTLVVIETEVFRQFDGFDPGPPASRLANFS
jgi:hypothetical protein